MTRFALLLLFSAVAFAQESLDGNYVETLTRVTEEAMQAVLNTMAKIESSPADFDNMTQERIDALEMEHEVQKVATNKNVGDAVAKGMLKNRVYSNFQCISDKSQETFKKLDEIDSKILETSQSIKKKGLALIKPFGLIMRPLYDFVKDLFQKKTEDLIKADNAETQKKIVKEVEDKIKLLKLILKEVDHRVWSLKYKFLEEHIAFTFRFEENFKKVQREGAGKIQKCVN